MKLALGLIAATALLASCGSSGTAPDGSGSGRILSLKTQFTSSTNPTPVYVGCDTVSGAASGREKKTQVVVNFSVAGTISSVRTQLKGVTTDTSGTTFDKTFVLSDPNVIKLADGTYQILFDADSSSGQFLPTSIVVEPNPKVRDPAPVTVNSADKVGQGFYAYLTITTNTGAKIPLTSQFALPIIPVYTNCTLNTAQPLSK